MKDVINGQNLSECGIKDRLGIHINEESSLKKTVEYGNISSRYTQ